MRGHAECTIILTEDVFQLSGIVKMAIIVKTKTKKNNVCDDNELHSEWLKYDYLFIKIIKIGFKKKKKKKNSKLSGNKTKIIINLTELTNDKTV